MDNSFQSIISKLQNFWGDNNCAILQSTDTEVGAGTLNPATALRCLTNENYNIAYVQGSRRPKDGRYGNNPNRLQHFHQFQVIMQPAPEDIQKICINSLAAIGLDTKLHDIRFVEDDWENPTIGAWGTGWEIWCDGMEIIQFTYMQQIGGVEPKIIPAEITYGLERIAMYIQGVNKFNDIKWNNANNDKYLLKYEDVFLDDEKQFSEYFLQHANAKMIQDVFVSYEAECQKLLTIKLPIPAWNYCLKLGHLFNILDARGVVGVSERALYISKIRNIARKCCETWIEVKNV